MAADEPAYDADHRRIAEQLDRYTGLAGKQRHCVRERVAIRVAHRAI